MINISKDVWTKGVLDIVTKISSKEYQERTWFGGSDQISSPEELSCQLFDDFLFDSFLASDDVGLTVRQRELGTQLKIKMEEFLSGISDTPDPRDVFNDPAWAKIREAAALLFDSFK